MNQDGRSSDSRIALLPAPSHPALKHLSAGQWHIAGFVPNHSGGSVPDFNRFPYYALKGHHQTIVYICICINFYKSEKRFCQAFSSDTSHFFLDMNFLCGI